MKTFLNVLYRRILYKIPLKLLLVILAFVAVFIASTKAENVSSLITYMWSSNITVNWNAYYTIYDFWDSNVNWTYCIYINDTDWQLYFATENSNYLNKDIALRFWADWDWEYLCITDVWKRYLFFKNETSTAVNIDYDLFELNALLTTTLPVMTSLECQQNYSLIPISSVDSNYCTTNNLCPSSECPVCPVWTGNISNVYINDILHVGAPFIFIDIPEEISWDYGYTQWWTNMLVNVEWYNVDYDYINWVVDIQSYKPDSEDLTNIVKTVLPLFVPWLCIILLLYFIFKFIKKIF